MHVGSGDTLSKVLVGLVTVEMKLMLLKMKLEKAMREDSLASPVTDDGNRCST